MRKTDLEQQCEAALYALLKHFGTKAELARAALMSRNAIGHWFNRGKVGRIAAIKFGKMKTVPFTKEQLRPDVKNWTPVALRKKV